jgi:hypothetical protein
MKTPKLLMYASLHGHTPTDEEIKLILPFVDRYNPEETSEPYAKRQKVFVPFKEKYKERIEEIERKQVKSIKASIERLNECRDGRRNCTISGGKNKKIMYGSTKINRPRTKSLCTRSCNRST